MRFPNIHKKIRICVYKHFYGMHVGAGARVGKIIFRNPKMIQLGESCTIEDGVLFNNHGSLDAPAKIVVARDCHIGRDTIFNCYFGVYVDQYSMIGPRCQLIDSDHSFETRSMPMGRQKASGSAIHIEKDVWIGANVIILKGCRIGNGAIVGAGSVVTKSIPHFEIWAGNPAKKIGLRP